ncbi:hypothetical protein [uncultured Parasphingopyxis sp.]|uniref:hypothetical protein n=1 Tax=uncultured Parasphingopyxis sp. TaxID=1547918 RepID=UPI00262FE2FF|nr:hypothetical protein [uncultured Parasphingopyxis sp.]
MFDGENSGQYPRRVKSLRGKARWLASDGHSYKSKTDAKRASKGTLKRSYEQWNSRPEDKIARPGMLSIALSCLGSALLAFAIYAIANGTISSNSWIQLIGIITFSILLLYCIAIFVVSVQAISAGKASETDLDQESESLAWAIGCFSVIAVIGVAGLAKLPDLFEGVSRGQTIIAVLLFAILMALIALLGKHRT